MAGYRPTYISKNETGLVQSRQEFILPNDAYPVLENAYIWREQIKRKEGTTLLGRLQRIVTNIPAPPVSAMTYSFNIFTVAGIDLISEPNATINPGSVVITLNTSTPIVFSDDGEGNLDAPASPPINITGNITKVMAPFGRNYVAFYSNNIPPQTADIRVFGLVGDASYLNTGRTKWTVVGLNPLFFTIAFTNPTLVTNQVQNGTWTSIYSGANTGTINYETGDVTITTVAIPSTTSTISFNYFPGLPAMGITQKDNQNAQINTTVFFDTKYAYVWNQSITGFNEFLPGTTWTGSDSEFFWTMNYWSGNSGSKIFWATNNSSTLDPIRYTTGDSGSNWQPFTPAIDSSGNFLWQALIILPYKNLVLAMNTSEGTSAFASKVFSNRIRWSALGNPFTVSSPIVTNVNPNAWNQTIPGQGNFIDVPTNEDIVSAGFVRDNIIIYCENSTWQLRYTGNNVSPFQIERVNSEIGALSTFGSIQFDTSLLTIGDKGIIECDSFKAEKIDIKIPDFVFELNTSNNGQRRIQGIRDFINKLAYWTYVSSNSAGIYPNMRLVYNYENDSWALFTDSLTCLGLFQIPIAPTWLSTTIPWERYNFPWISVQNLASPDIVGGNQQGFISYLDEQTINDPSLFISNIVGQMPNPTKIVSPNHNLQTGQIITITGIVADDPFYDVNGGVYSVTVLDANSFTLSVYNPLKGAFNTNQLDSPGTYLGGGLIAILDNFQVQSKKFNYLEEGQSIQLGFIDILCDATENGAITLNVYIDYNDSLAINEFPNNLGNTFFNSVIPTSEAPQNNRGGSKYWQRIFCPVRGNFITLEYTFSNAQMAGIEQSQDVQIDAQVLHMRPAGRLTQF